MSEIERDLDLVLISGAGASAPFGVNGTQLPMMGEWSDALVKKLGTRDPSPHRPRPPGRCAQPLHPHSPNHHRRPHRKPLGTPHIVRTEAVAAECHFPAKAVGGTDVGLFASTNVPQGIKESYQGKFFATLDTFKLVYGTPTPLASIGTAAYVATRSRIARTSRCTGPRTNAKSVPTW
jgi:hypothetical protein